MAQETITLPGYDSVGNFKSELQRVVSVANRNRKVAGEFIVRGEYSLAAGVYDCSLDGFPKKVEENPLASDVIQPLTVMLAAAWHYAAQRSKQGKTLDRLSFDLLRRPVSPRALEQLGWHCGDTARMLAALGITTRVAVGALPVPPDLKRPADPEGQIRFAGRTLRTFVKQNQGKLPDGVEEIYPAIGELVFVGRDCVHRPPDNETGEAIDRLFVKVTPHYS